MRKYISEFIGTAVLVLVGCGSAVAANALFSAMGMGLPVAFTTLLTAIAFGLAVISMYYAIGHISGCHLNPAVSFAMMLSKRMSIKDFVGYVIAQCVGAIGGAGLLAVIIHGRTTMGANGYGDSSTFGISMWTAFLIEVVLTFVFVMTFLGATDKKNQSPASGVVIGLSLSMIYLFAVPFTGGCVNPARALGPAILQGTTALTQVGVFVAAPLVGALVAAFVYMFLNMEPKAKAVEIAGELPEVIEEDTLDVDMGEVAAESVDESAEEDTEEISEEITVGENPEEKKEI